MISSCGNSRIFEITGVVYKQKHIQLLNIKVPMFMLFVLFKFQSDNVNGNFCFDKLPRNKLDIQPTY